MWKPYHQYEGFGDDAFGMYLELDEVMRVEAPCDRTIALIKRDTRQSLLGPSFSPGSGHRHGSRPQALTSADHAGPCNPGL